MSKWKLNGCLRCGGDVFIEKDSEEWCEHCLQCGYLRCSAADAVGTRRHSIHPQRSRNANSKGTEWGRDSSVKRVRVPV